MKKTFLSLMALCVATSMFANFAAQRDSSGINCGDQVKIVAQPKEGQHFMYWSDLKKDDADYNSTERLVTIMSDTTIRAIFQIDKYEIIWNNWDGTFIVKDSVEYGTTPTFSGTTPTKTATQQYSYEFIGWGDGNTYTNGMVSATKDTTYVAMFKEIVNQYTLSYTVTPEGKGTITGKVGEADAVSGTKYDYGSTVTLTAEKDDDCYEFVGWFKADDLSGTAVSDQETYTFELQDNVSLIAKFKQKQFKVTVIADPADKGDVDIVEP